LDELKRLNELTEKNPDTAEYLKNLFPQKSSMRWFAEMKKDGKLPQPILEAYERVRTSPRVADSQDVLVLDAYKSQNYFIDREVFDNIFDNMKYLAAQ
jgi:hypothetical protein